MFDLLTILLIVLIVFCIIRVEYVAHARKVDNAYTNYNFQQVALALSLPTKTQEEVENGANNG